MKKNANGQIEITLIELCKIEFTHLTSEQSGSRTGFTEWVSTCNRLSLSWDWAQTNATLTRDSYSYSNITLVNEEQATLAQNLQHSFINHFIDQLNWQKTVKKHCNL